MWEYGRTLPTYQFVYITRGVGMFDSKLTGSQPVRAGDLMVLFPQLWHRYRPLADTGWDEYWLEFDGDYIRCLMARDDFTPERPVLHIGVRYDVLDLFLKAIDLLRNEPPEYQVLVGTLAAQAIGYVLSALKQISYEDRPVAGVIREAKRWLVCEPIRNENLEHLATRLNMSYSVFGNCSEPKRDFPHANLPWKPNCARPLIY
jgi:AraC-like ligand binding domain